MATLYYPPTKDFAQGTLGAELLDGVTASATLNTTASTIGLQNAAGVMIVDRVDANGTETPTKVEVISFTGTSGSTVTTLGRGLAGTTDQDHAVGAIVEFGPDCIWAQGLIDTIVVEHNTDGTHKAALVTTLKATGAVVNTGTSDVTIVTPKALADSNFKQYIDEDDMATNSATKVPSQQSVKAYVDTQDASGTVTMTNKRITKRITTITSHANPTINTDNCDAVTITAQAEAIASMTTNLSGTPTNFQTLVIRIKDNGTARGITWGTGYEAKGIALPTTTVISKVLTVGFIYDTVTSKWGCVASAQEA